MVLLRVTIDKLPEQALAGELITVDDFERVTRQLQYVLEVEAYSMRAWRCRRRVWIVRCENGGITHALSAKPLM